MEREGKLLMFQADFGEFDIPIYKCGGRKNATYIRVYFNVQLSIVMKVDKTGFLRALALLNLL